MANDNLTPDESSAYHEAGHAAAAYQMGIEVQSVTLWECVTGPAKPKARSVLRAFIAAEIAQKKMAQDDAKRHAVLGLAGVIAQDKFRRKTDPTERARQCCDALLRGGKFPIYADLKADDFGKVILLLKQVFDPDSVDSSMPQKAAHDSIERALTVLVDRWGAVEAMATALWTGRDANRTLSSNDVKAAMDGLPLRSN